MSLMSQAEFARHIGKTPGYITQQKASGRIVMQGRMVNVEESIKLISETSDPSKAGVVDRHAHEREQKQISQPASDKSGHELEDMAGKSGSAYQKARAMKEKYAALQVKASYEKEIGLLRVAQEVEAIAAEAGAVCCNQIESMFYALAPQLSDERDEQKILAIMLNYWEIIRADLSRKLKELQG